VDADVLRQVTIDQQMLLLEEWEAAEAADAATAVSPVCTLRSQIFTP